MTDLKKLYKEASEKATKFVKKIDKESIEEFAENSRKNIQSKLQEYGVNEKIDVIKKESSVIGDSISQSAKEVYKENEEILEKPVAKVNEVISAISKHTSKIKWAGAITAGVVAPVPTLVASSLFYLLSSEDEKEKRETQTSDRKIDGVSEKEVIESTAKMLEKKESLPEKIQAENEWVKVTLDVKNNVAYGTVMKGHLKGTSFNNLGVDAMKSLAEQLPQTESAEDAKTLINHWIHWKNS